MSKSSSRHTKSSFTFHPIRSPDDKIMPSRISQDGTGWVGHRWTSSNQDLYLMAPKLGQGPPHSPRSPWEALFTILDHMGVQISLDKLAQSNKVHPRRCFAWSVHPSIGRRPSRPINATDLPTDLLSSLQVPPA
jgi:hypothetical protein